MLLIDSLLMVRAVKHMFTLITDYHRRERLFNIKLLRRNKYFSPSSEVAVVYHTIHFYPTPIYNTLLKEQCLSVQLPAKSFYSDTVHVGIRIFDGFEDLRIWGVLKQSEASIL